MLAKAKSCAERLFVFERIEHFIEDLARETLSEPAATEGVVWDEDALTYVVEETVGYHYFLQQFGQDTWNEAPGPGVTFADARVGAARAKAALDDGFFRARWDRATLAEQRYLRAMASDEDGGSPSGDIATRLGRGVNSFGPAPASIVTNGLIYVPEHGVVTFTVPGMAGFSQGQSKPRPSTCAEGSSTGAAGQACRDSWLCEAP